jgi:hypothetical protein
MDIIKDKITGNLVIKKSGQYHNVEVDNLVIEADTTARVFGTIRKSISIKPRATIHFHGRFSGTIINDNGNIHLYDS